MTPRKDFTINQGETFRVVFGVEQASCGRGSPVDLTGAVAKMQIRATHKSPTVILDLYEEGFITIPQPLLGEILINVPADVTAEFTFGSAVYDLEIHYSNGDVSRLVEGRMALSPEVTRG